MMAFWINVVLVAGLAFGLSQVSAILGPRRRIEGDKGLPFETGMRPMGDSSSRRISVLYYRFAVLFVIFDVDLAFLVPWILLRDSLTLTAMLSMTGFFLILGFMLMYVSRKGLLTCQ